MTEDTDTTLVGTAVGNYQVVKRLGKGAMGEVFLGEHPAIGRRVAIKVVMDSLSSNPEVTDRFLSEARAVSKVNHPNIIQIFDFGTLPDGRLYYVMEYLDGQELSELLTARAPLPPREAQDLLRQITAAMEAAHAAGIVHRDLKPDNIFVASTDSGPLVKILDFGIAKLLEPAFGSESQTATGMIMGTPLYMSPEQAAGQVNQISPRTDIYALGIITYEMLCGRCPFQSPTTALVLTMHITEPPPPLQTFVNGLPPSLETFIQRALSKEPEGRHQSMNEYFVEFQQASSGGADALQPTLAGGDTDIEGAATVAADSIVPTGKHPNQSTGLEATVADTGAGLTADTTLGRSATESVPNGVAATGRSPSRVWLSALLVLLTVAIAGITWYVLKDGQPPPKAAQPTTEPVAQAPDAAPEPPVMRPVEPPVQRPPARPAIRQIQVSSRKGRLKVLVTVPGAPPYTRRTPFTVDARQGERVVLVARRRGYHAETRTFIVAEDRKIELALTRLGRPRPRPMVKEPPAMRPKTPVMRPKTPVMRPMTPAMRPMDVGESTISPFGMK